MSLVTNAPVIGLDNFSPLYNPEGKFQIWGMKDIYLGQNGEGKYVPKVDDLVCEVVGRVVTFYIVHSIDPVTFIPVLVEQDNSKHTESFTNDDILYGSGPGTLSDTYRIYLDQSVTPYRLSVDKRLWVGGSTCTNCRLYLGTDTTNPLKVISGMYDSTGSLISQNVPLEIINTAGTNNTAMKTVQTCFTTQSMINGEIVTAVMYDDNGMAISKRQLYVENTGFVMSPDTQTRYVSHIGLETPFLSLTNNKLIEYPINVPINSMNLIGVVYYSDGSSVRLAVDGNRFSVFGLDNYSATIAGQKSELVLKYKLDTNESALDVHIGSDAFISEIYKIVTVTTNTRYAVQLYPYPVWNNTNNSYSLKWHLFDLDRTISYDVTPNVLINTNHASFNPSLLGAKQSLNVSINLRSVNGNYNNFNHVQTVDITLVKNGTERPILDTLPNWTVANRSNQSTTYGNGVYTSYERVTNAQWNLRIHPKANTKANWLKDLYTNTNPLFDPILEAGELLPTHFVVLINNSKFEYTIDKWNTTLSVNQVVTNNDTLFIKFIKRTNMNDLQLSIAGTSIFQADINGTFV